MVDYARNIKIGVFILIGIAILAILAVVLLPALNPFAPKTAADPASEAMYEMVWNGKTNDHVVIKDFAAFMNDTDKPILIDFWAEWCGPCRSAAPTIEKLAEKYAGRIRVVKINTDYAAPVAQAFGVTGIPNFVIVQDNKVVQSITGYSETLEQNLSDLLDGVLG